MIKKYIFDESIKLDRNVSCIGYFDGVHKGHQELIKETIKIAKEKGVKASIITFNPDPLDVITKKENRHINTLDERIVLFEKFKLDQVIVIPFDEKLMETKPDLFIEQVLNKLNIDTLICGFDFTFGYCGMGNSQTLIKSGINVKIIEEKKYYGKKISSSRIKNEIDKGNYKLVNKLLGYEYQK